MHFLSFFLDKGKCISPAEPDLPFSNLLLIIIPPPTPVPNVREVIFKLKKEGKRLFLLSNISIGFSENYKKTPWINEVLSEFDGLILSGVTGLLKPDPEVFEYILSKYNLKREETLFIDDSPKNIKGAEAVRLRGYLFNGDGLKLERFLSGL